MNRPALITLIGKPNLVGCEIGTALGNNAHSILTELSIVKLYLIDPYIFDDSNGKSAGVHPTKELADQSEAQAHACLKKFKDKIVWLKKISWTVTKQDIPLESLDFVYIDGNHSEEAVKSDILTFFPFLKKGGLLSGHDYDANGTGVKKAVHWFCSEHKYDCLFHVPEMNGKREDWWLIK